jgi:hypothetical protein
MTTIRVRGGWFAAAAIVTALVHVAFAQSQTGKAALLSTIDAPANYVRAEGSRLYVAADRTLNIFDVTNPSTPRRLGGYTFPENVRAMIVSGAIVFVSAEFNLLRIVEATDAAAPVERGSLPIRSGIRTMAMSEPGLIVMTTSLEGFEVVDVSNPSSPARISSNLFTDSYSQGVAASGRLVLAADSSTGVFVFDLTSPKSAEVIATLPHAYARLAKDVPPAWISPDLAIAAANGSTAATTAVVLDKVTGHVEIVDVTDPRKPASVGAIDLGSRAQGLALRGSRVYVGTRQGVQIVDLATPANPARVGAIGTTQPPQDIAVSDPYVFVAFGRGGAGIFSNILSR